MRVMRICWLIALGLLAPALRAEDTPWQVLLDRADSLAAHGYLDSAQVVFETATEKALTEYDISDTTVEFIVRGDGPTMRYYFPSYAYAESLYRRRLAVKERIVGYGHPECAQILTDIAELCWHQGKYSDAESLHREALTIRREVNGAGHPDVAESLTGIGRLYTEQGMLAEAEPLFEWALAIKERSYGPDHPAVATCLNNLATLRYYQGNYEEAESLFTRALSIRKKTLDADDFDLAASYNNLALLHYTQGRYSEAESLYVRALAVAELALGSDSPKVAASLNNLANLYSEQGKYTEAESLYTRALCIKTAALGPAHPDVASSLSDLGRLFGAQGRHHEAESLYTMALDIETEALGPEHPDVANSLHNMALLYQDQGRYREAEDLYNQSLAIKEKSLGPKHPIVVMSLNGLAALYCQQGRYTEAEFVYRKALDISLEVFGPEHPDVAVFLHNLGRLYWELGDYSEAEPLLRRAHIMKEGALGPEHPEVAKILLTIADLLTDQGSLGEAEALLLRATAISEKVFGAEHPATAACHRKLAILYISEGRYEEAAPLLARALATAEMALGPEHPDVAYSLNGLGVVYTNQGRYSLAETVLRRALAIREKVLGLDHPQVAHVLMNLGDLYVSRRDLSAAERVYKRARSIWERSLGPMHPDVAASLESISTLHRLENRNSEGFRDALLASRIRHQSFVENAFVLSENQALTYSQFMRESISNCLSCYFDLNDDDLELRMRIADIVLPSKGLVSDGLFGRRRDLIREADSVAAAIAEDLRYTKFRLSELFVKGFRDTLVASKARRDSLRGLARDLEELLSRRSESYRRRREYRNATNARIASLIPGGTVLLEFIRYGYKRLQPKSTEAHYMVIALDSERGPLITDLGKAAPIDGLIEQYRRHMLEVSEGGGSPGPVDMREYERIAQALYELVWKPVEPCVAGKEMVFVAPDGTLNLVAFAGLMDENGRYLVEQWAVHYLSAGRDLIRLKDEPPRGRGLLAIGDPDYDAGVPTRVSASAATGRVTQGQGRSPTRRVRSGCKGLQELVVDSLPATRHEVQAIASRWARTSNDTATVYTGADASEERFKAEAQGKRVIHLATHGYFLGGFCQPDVKIQGFESDVGYVGENPLLLSGLLLAGANLHGAGGDGVDAEDGVLTAYEVSTLDLDGVEMVVLSACETALGEVQEGEGVYGLRRAFQMAGARTVISALWQIPDEVTADMMTELYARGDTPLSEAMRTLQLGTINSLRKQEEIDHPFTWGAFIAQGDWK
jgi:tetratricopeptide (TPR) repeat protein/CHAT domain-containing protein